MPTKYARADVNHTGLATCLCAACAGGVDPRLLDPSSDGAVDASLDPSAGGTFNNKPIFSLEQVVANLNRTGGGFANGFGNEANNGRQNNIGDDANTITFGFFNKQDQLLNNGYGYTANDANGNPTDYALDEYFNFASFSEAQRAAAREAMQGWDDVVAVSFKEVGADDADMNFGNLASAPSTQAYARIPTAGLDTTLGGQVREIGGDTWISASQPSNFQLDEGGYGLQTLAHEIGHSIGISHPGGYNAAPGKSITYAANAEYAQDTRAYSIMSYFNGSSIAGTRHFDFNISGTVYAGTPLIHDIAVAQAIYGADMTTRTGDTIYGFNTNTDRDAFDFSKTPAPIVAIWDAGGNDTIDASGYATEQLIDLTPGSLSSIGGVTFDTAPSFEQTNLNRAAAGMGPIPRSTYDGNMAALKANAIVGRLTDNVGIAYGVTIENAIGGSGNDTIIGNAVANVLTGNAGNDVLIGGGGADTLDGGLGVDTASYRNATSGVTASLLGGTAGDAAGDRYSSIEAIEGSNFADTLTATNGADVLSGLGGDDVLSGGNGNDVLDGGTGNDKLDGGNGNDVLRGGDGDDSLVAGIGDDALFGGAGIDSLSGGIGNDTLNGGAGADRLLGGTGNDIFVFTDLGATDVIVDFSRGSDKIDLSGIDANSGIAGDQAFSFIGNGAFTAAGQVRTYQEAGNYFIAGDINGDGIADFVIQINAPVVATDFIAF